MRKKLQVGETYHNLTIIEHLGVIKHKATHYRCKCSCGKEVIYQHSLILKGVVHKNCNNLKESKHYNLKLKPKEASFRAKFTNYRSSARYRKLDFDLEFEDCLNLFSENCYYCGNPPSNSYNAILRNRKYKTNYKYYKDSDYDIVYNGIDRVDNSKGYIKGNCVSCCSICNTMKLSLNLEDFKEHINKIYKKFNT